MTYNVLWLISDQQRQKWRMPAPALGRIKEARL